MLNRSKIKFSWQDSNSKKTKKKPELLTNNEKKLIVNSKYGCLEKLIEIVHCGKYSQFKNVILTNMKDNYMYKYDDAKGCFILGTKSEIMNSLVDGKLFDLDVIYNDLLEKNKIDERTKNCIEDFVNRIHNNDEKFTDIDGKEHENYKHYKIFFAFVFLLPFFLLSSSFNLFAYYSIIFSFSKSVC